MNKRILSLVLALVMVLGTFGTVFAASYDDVTGTDVASAVDRLSTLGILEGYPDGTFKPANSITRAEFAAVAARAKGLESVAQAAKGLATGFNDVPATHWASGYVGTAAKLGIVNGMGYGQFVPEAPVKYEDAVTMIVRALGYEAAAQAKGGYPYGYLIVANENGLLDDVKGTQGVAATRGMVAQLTDNALEIPMMIQVGFGSDAKWVISGSKEHGDDAVEKYLLDELGFDSVKGRVVSVNTKTDKIIVDPTDEDLKNVTLEVAEGFDFYAVEGLETKFWYKNDTVEVFVVNEEAKFDAVKVDKDELVLIVEDESYEVARGAILTVDGEKVAQNKFVADYAKVVFNDDDEIIWAQGYTLDGFILVEEVEDEVALSYDDFDEVKLKDFTVVKEGKTIGIDGIEEQDILFYNNDEEFAIVYNNGTEGELDRVYTDLGFRFEGSGYEPSLTAEPLYFDEGKVGELNETILDDLLDEEATITVYVDFRGKVVVISAEISSVGNSAFAVLTKDVNKYDGRRGDLLAIDLRNGEGAKVSYDILVSDLNKGVTLQGINPGQLEVLKEANDEVLKITLDKDGDVTKLEKPAKFIDADEFDIDDSNVKVNGISYKLQANTIVFHDGNDKATTLGNAKDVFEEVKAGSTVYVEKGRVVAVVGETDADADTMNVTGLVTGVRTLTGGKLQFTVKVFGETQRLVTEDKNLNVNNFTNWVDSIRTFKVGETSGEIKVVNVSTEKDTFTIKSRTGRTITPNEVGKNEVELNRNAKIYDKNLEEISVNDLAKNDEITVYFQGSSNRFVDYVMAATGEEEIDPEVKADGMISESYTVTTSASTIVIGGKAFDVRANAVMKDKDNATLTTQVLTPETKVSFTVVEGTSQIFTLKVEDRTIADIVALKTVEDAIIALPKVADLVVGNKTAVDNAKAAYDALTSARKNLVQSANKVKLEAAVAKIAELVVADTAAQLVITEITNLNIAGATATLAEREAIADARESYDNLSSAAKALVTNYDDLVDFEDILVVEDASAALTVKFAVGDSDASVTKDVTLVSTLKGATISWSSNNAAVITASGIVTRPAAGTSDATVVLTATIIKGATTATETFSLTVLQAE